MRRWGECAVCFVLDWLGWLVGYLECGADLELGRVGFMQS